MRYFPIFHDLKDRPVVVVGGGEEALCKIRLLLKTEARIVVIAETLHGELTAESRVHWLARRYEAGLIEGATLVFSADPSLSEIVAADAAALGIPVNAVDNPLISTFIVPSIVDRDPLVIAIGTEGAAPVLGQGLRARIDAMLPSAMGNLAKAGAGLRDRVAAGIPAGNRRRSFWHRYFFGDVRDAFIANESVTYLAGIEGLFGSEAAAAVGRVSFIGVTSDDPELLTIKAHRKLQEADVIVHDRSIAPAILEMARRDAVRIPVAGRLFDGTDTILIREAKLGRHVVRMLAGEPSLEETVAVAADGVAIETVPGIAAVAPVHDVPLPVRDEMRGYTMRIAS